jgi:hypothetical protein
LKIEHFINDKNREIWDKLNSSYQIELVYDPKETSWRIDSEDILLKRIITPTRKNEISSFTHELLHLYIDDLGMSTPLELLNVIRGEKSFEVLTNNGLFAIVHNFCSHSKMFPYYDEMGFPEDEFVSKPATLGLVSLFLLKFQLNMNQLMGVTHYIGNVIALCNNMGQSKEKYNKMKLDKLAGICPSLFAIIMSFDNKWKDTVNLDLTTPFIEFNTELEEWLDVNIPKRK